MDKDRQIYQLHQKGYAELVKAISELKSDTQKVKLEGVALATIKGDKGDTPVKGKDYFTKAEIEEFLSKSKPVKGKDYFTKEDQKSIVNEVMSLIPPPKDGKDAVVDYKKIEKFVKSEVAKIEIPVPEPGKDAVVDYNSIIISVLKQIPAVDLDPIKKELKEEVKKYYESAPRTRILNSGGPTTRLGELVDVNLEGATNGQVLALGPNGNWHAVDMSGGVSSFVDLTDTPDTYTGQSTKIVRVKADETGLEFVTPSSEADTLQTVTDRGRTIDIIDDSFAIQVRSSDGLLEKVDIGNGSDGAGFVNLFKLDGSLGINLEGNTVTAERGSFTGELVGSIYRAVNIDTSVVGSGRSIPLQMTYDDPSTSLTGNISGMFFVNNNTTDNSYAGLAFGSKDLSGTTTVNAFVHGVMTSHTSGSPSADLAFGTRNAGTLSASMFLRADGRLYIERDNLSPNGIAHHLLELKAHTSSTGNGFGAGIRFMNQETIGATPWEMGYVTIGRDGHDQSGIYKIHLSSVGTSRNVWEIDKDGNVVQTNYGASNAYLLSGNLNGGNYFATTNQNVHAQAIAGYEANANSSRKFGLYAPSSIHTNVSAGFTNTAVLRSEVYPTLAIINNQANGAIHFRTDGSLTSNNRVVINSSGLGVFVTPTNSPASGVDVADGNITLLLGAENNARTRTNSQTKITRIANFHYTNAEEPSAMIMGSSNSTDNVVNIGGGSLAMNAATTVNFYTANNNTTQTGTVRGTIDLDGNWILVLPTSSAGLPTGALWNNSGVVNIV
jgi:hypothetical protein